MYEDRIEKAYALFMKGYNCAQSVTAAFADLYGLTEEQALLASASFGGGMGRMRLTCGTVTGMFLLAGLESGTTNPDDRELKARNYAMVRELAERFKTENGSIVCSELLQMGNKTESAMPSERTAAYYKKRPCPELVRCAARIYAQMLEEKKSV
ncbi:MAG: C-GCAxxG-C-C family protein [Bacteroidaceae bacterium]|nr:C-GCAxxG-C-C family protein [Bacteroidaceae bacterium]